MTVARTGRRRASYAAVLILLGAGVACASFYVGGLLVTAVEPRSVWDAAAAVFFVVGLAAGCAAVAAGVWQMFRAAGSL